MPQLSYPFIDWMSLCLLARGTRNRLQATDGRSNSELEHGEHPRVESTESISGGVQASQQELTAKEVERAEAASLLERRMTAMEAILAARRAVQQEPAAQTETEAAREGGGEMRFQVRPTPWRKKINGQLLQVLNCPLGSKMYHLHGAFPWLRLMPHGPPN